MACSLVARSPFASRAARRQGRRVPACCVEARPALAGDELEQPEGICSLCGAASRSMCEEFCQSPRMAYAGGLGNPGRLARPCGGSGPPQPFHAETRKCSGATQSFFTPKQRFPRLLRRGRRGWGLFEAAARHCRAGALFLGLHCRGRCSVRLRDGRGHNPAAGCRQRGPCCPHSHCCSATGAGEAAFFAACCAEKALAA